MSLWDLLALPDQAWVALFSISLILILAFFFEEADFGFIKTPKIRPDKRRTVLALGLTTLGLTVLMAVPNRYVEVFASSNSTIEVTTDSSKQFEPLLSSDDNGQIVFSFSSDTLGEMSFSESRLVHSARVFAGKELAETQTIWDELSKEQQAALALAQKSFEQKRYSDAARFFQYAMEEIPTNIEKYSEVRGMATAGYYGAGEHRKGLNYICKLYKKFPSQTSKYRHAIHAHIRRIALTESFTDAEDAMDALRETFGCNFDDFTYSWIPIPLGFMEGIQRGIYIEPSLTRSERAVAEQYIAQNRKFSDYLLLMLGGEDRFRIILNQHDDSFVFDHATYMMAMSVDPNLQPSFSREYVRTYEGERAVDVILHVAGSLDWSESGNPINELEDFFDGSLTVLSDENLINRILKYAPLELTNAVAEEYLQNNVYGPNSSLSAKILLQKSLEGETDSPPPDLIRLAYRSEQEDEKKILVLSFRKRCTSLKSSFESLSFGAAAETLKDSHRSFIRYFGSSSYEVATWLDTSGFRGRLPCAGSFGGGSDRIAGTDMVITISFLQELDAAMFGRDLNIMSRLALDLHNCHISRLTGTASKGMNLCGALSRVLPEETSFGRTAVELHDMVYNMAPSIMYKHLFLSALADRRNDEFFAYTEKLLDFTLLHSDTNLIDDVYTELGWYSAQTGDYDIAERHLRHVLDNYEHMNAYDNALYWLEYVAEVRGDIAGQLAANAELATYLIGRRQIERITGSEEELRMRTPELLEAVSD